MQAVPQWLQNVVAAAGMTAYADGLEYEGNKSATDNNPQDEPDPPGNVH